MCGIDGVGDQPGLGRGGHGAAAEDGAQVVEQGGGVRKQRLLVGQVERHRVGCGGRVEGPLRQRQEPALALQVAPVHHRQRVAWDDAPQVVDPIGLGAAVAGIELKIKIAAPKARSTVCIGCQSTGGAPRLYLEDPNEVDLLLPRLLELRGLGLLVLRVRDVRARLVQPELQIH